MIQPKQGRQSKHDQHKHITDEDTPPFINENAKEGIDEQERASQRRGACSAAGWLWPTRGIPNAAGHVHGNHGGN
jgi:hypothetical protein